MRCVRFLWISTLIALVLPSAATAETVRVPYIYQVSGQTCLVPVTAVYRDVRHKRYAISRVFTSFSELALEREKTAPLPTAGWTTALYDLILLHIAGDCENRIKWAQVLIDDYHGRFPDDALLTIARDRSMPDSFFDRYHFRRIEPVYSILECRVGIKQVGSKVDVHNFSDAVYAAINDYYSLSGDRAIAIRIGEPATQEELKLVFLSQCENRGDIAKSIAKRAKQIDPELSLRVRTITSSEYPDDKNIKSSVYRDTRKGLQDYLPPRHDVK